MAWACQAVAGPAIFTAKEATKLIPAHRNLSIDQNGHRHLPFRLPDTFMRRECGCGPDDVDGDAGDAGTGDRKGEESEGRALGGRAQKELSACFRDGE